MPNITTSYEEDKLIHFRMNNVDVYNKTFVLPLFRTHYISVYLGKSDWLQWLNDVTIDYEPHPKVMDGRSVAYYYKHGNTVSLFFTEHNNIGQVAHECLHALLHICEDIGIGVNTEESETASYILQWMVKEVGDFLSIENHYKVADVKEVD
jgi:hypothetical protein